MKRTLLEQTKIGDSLSIDVEMEEGEIRLEIVSANGSVSHVFGFDEWENFVDGVKRANASMAAEED